jgi:Ras-related C3 botulinum toxin substrate 1
VNRLCVDIVVDENTCWLELCNTAAIIPQTPKNFSIYNHVDVVIVCFSLINPISFERVITRWYAEFASLKKKVPVLLVGTKLDLRDHPQVISQLRRHGLTPITFAHGMQMAKKIGAYKYFECSSLTKQGLEELFQEIIFISRAWKRKSDGNCLIL